MRFRSLRWLDRCIGAHSRPNEQSLFPIIQGGLDEKLREQSVKGLFSISNKIILLFPIFRNHQT